MQVIIINHTIRVKVGAGSMLLNVIKNDYPLPATKGFIDVELLLISGTEVYEEYTIRTKWKTIKSYETWRKAYNDK